jgi:tRNA1(Val) A37 N6-methylase TrmN6
MKFDLIIGNPPYQKNTKSNKNICGCRTHIWDKFILSGFNLTKDNGYLSFIHPIGWRLPDGIYKNLGDIIKSKKIIYLKLGIVN